LSLRTAGFAAEPWLCAIDFRFRVSFCESHVGVRLNDEEKRVLQFLLRP